MGCFFTAALLLRAPSPRPFKPQLYTHMGTRLFPALSLFLAPLLAAQTVPPAGSTAGSAAQQEVLELSPFQVTAEAFKGYYASQTLAGSRLKRNSWFRFVAPTSCMNSGVMICTDDAISSTFIFRREPARVCEA